MRMGISERALGQHLSGWDETNFLGQDRDREIRLIKTHYETETEK